MADIAAIQRALNAKGYGPLDVDGASGPLTQAAIKKFQAAHPPLAVDGVCGPMTLAALGLSPIVLKHPPLQAIAMGQVPGLWPATTDHFTAFTIAYEGKTPYPYTDSKGLVTTGIGNLIDDGSAGPMQALPWRHGVGGPLATSQEVGNAYDALKSAWPGVQSTACASLTDLRLDDAGIAAVVGKQLASNQNYLKGKYPGLPSWPADAQLAMHSLAWAWGPAFANVWTTVDGQGFVNAANALRPDFGAMAGMMKDASAHEETINAGIIPRDAATENLFNNANDVLAKNADRTKLYYPNDVTGLGLSTLAIMLAFGGVGLGLIGYYKYKGVI